MSDNAREAIGAAAPEQEISEVRKVRLDKLAALEEAGKDPFELTTYERTATAGAIRADYDAYEGKSVSVAGRLMSKRVMGKASFGHIADSRRHGRGELSGVQKAGRRRHHRREGHRLQD